MSVALCSESYWLVDFYTSKDSLIEPLGISMFEYCHPGVVLGDKHLT